MKVTNPTVNRKYIEDPRLWGVGLGTDFTFGTGTTTALITSGTAGQVLSEFGWTTTTLAYVAGSAADFLSSADKGVPPHLLLADASDLLASPAVFGDFSHGRAASRILGYMPTTLNFECLAAFTTASNNEPSTGFGFVEDGGSVITAAAADHMACITSNGTNFILSSGAATDTGAVIDTSWHVWRVSVSASGCEWFIDDVSQGSIALQTDEWPVSFEAGVVAAGANDVAISHFHVWYA